MDNIKNSFYNLIRPLYHLILDLYYSILARVIEGALPDFIIIGVQKGGTTALFDYLTEHPEVTTSFRKEVHFFDLKYKKGINWYKAQFLSKKKKNQKKSKMISGEGSPYYIYHPFVAKRIAQHIPNVKLIVLFRDPIDRAYSHYRHIHQKKIANFKSFEEALKFEQENLPVAKKSIFSNKYSNNSIHQHYSFVDRGNYSQQMKVWYKYFKQEQILELKSEDFFLNPEKILAEVCKFLEVKPHVFSKVKPNKNFSYTTKIKEETYQSLQNYYQTNPA